MWPSLVKAPALGAGISEVQILSLRPVFRSLKFIFVLDLRSTERKLGTSLLKVGGLNNRLHHRGCNSNRPMPVSRAMMVGLRPIDKCKSLCLTNGEQNPGYRNKNEFFTGK